jgi:type I restriction enzyme S subunit
MPVAFSEIPIEELCTKVTSGLTPLRSRSDFYANGTIDWYKTGELNDWYLESAQERIAECAFKETSIKLFPAETVLMAMYGDGRTITSMGMLRSPAATNQACAAMFVNREKCHPRYFFYALKGRRDLLLKVASGGAQRNLSGKLMKEFRLPVPALPTQQRIASILSAYDELIENSQRRIKILEAMARGLYREWFVHFRFPGHENHPRVASALGEIPKGWEVKTVEEIVKRLPVGKKYDQKTVSPTGAIPVFDQGKSGIIGYHDDQPGVEASEKAPVIVFANHTCYQRLVHFSFSAIQNVLPFVPHPSVVRNIYWLHWATNGLVVFNDYKGHWPEFAAKSLVVPSEGVCQSFGDFVAPLSRQILKMERLIDNLRATRDLLLPRLLSGQIEVETT